jgi:hypothetical protein
MAATMAANGLEMAAHCAAIAAHNNDRAAIAAPGTGLWEPYRRGSCLDPLDLQVG